MKKEGMDSGLYVLQKSVQSRLEPNQFHCHTSPDLLHFTATNALPLFQRAYDGSPQSLQKYRASEETFMKVFEKKQDYRLKSLIMRW